MDGLMFDTEALNMRGWIEAGKLHGFEITEAHVRKHIGANVTTTKALMLEQFGEVFDFDRIRKDRIAWVFAYIEKNGTPVKSGLRELLAFLREKGLKTALASSTEERIVRVYLEHAHLEHRFDVVVCGDMAKEGKPAPDIFLLARSKLDVPAGACLVLEDSYNGILAAHRAGIRSVMIPDLLPPTPEMEKLFFRKLDALHDVIPLIESLRESGELQSGELP
jgi:HAD superfamily hydrolase (TIGR01509 family)